METFNALAKSIRAVPHELIEQTIQLHAQNPQAFENSLGALCAAVCDTFNRLQLFDRVVANPMWNQDWWKEGDYDADELDRFPKGAG